MHPKLKFALLISTLVVGSFKLTHYIIMNDASAVSTNVAEILCGWLSKPENQAILCAGAFLMVAWLVLSWVIHMLFTLLWPISLATLLMVMILPAQTTQWIWEEFLPSLASNVQAFSTMASRTANNTYHIFVPESR